MRQKARDAIPVTRNPVIEQTRDERLREAYLPTTAYTTYYYLLLLPTHCFLLATCYLLLTTYYLLLTTYYLLLTTLQAPLGSPVPSSSSVGGDAVAAHTDWEKAAAG